MFKLRKLWWMVLISAAIALWYWQRQWATRQWTTRLRALPTPSSTTDSLAGRPFATDLDARIIDHESSWRTYAEPEPPAEPAPPSLDVVATDSVVSAAIAPSSVTEPHDTADTAAVTPDQIEALAPAPEAAVSDGTLDQPDARAPAHDDLAPAAIAPDQIEALAPVPEAAVSDGTLDQPDARAPAHDDLAPAAIAPDQIEALAPVPEAAVSEPAPPPDVPAPTTPTTQPERININTASIKKLTSLPGIGPTLARRIVAYRKANGPFTSVEGLLKVQGIGINNLKDFIDRIQV